MKIPVWAIFAPFIAIGYIYHYFGLIDIIAFTMGHIALYFIFGEGYIEL